MHLRVLQGGGQAVRPDEMFFRNEEARAPAESPLRRLREFLRGGVHLQRLFVGAAASADRPAWSVLKFSWKLEALRQMKKAAKQKKERAAQTASTIVMSADPVHQKLNRNISIARRDLDVLVADDEIERGVRRGCAGAAGALPADRPPLRLHAVGPLSLSFRT